MEYKKILATTRLNLEILSEEDVDFILELVNTREWVTFIGNKNIHSPEEATAYIQKISNSQNCCYWTVKLKDSNVPAGLITLIKRDYLEHLDIGFAFLPKFYNNGYGYEGAKAVMLHLAKYPQYKEILAETLPGNAVSIRLIEKLGLKFVKMLEINNEVLHIYSALLKEI
jgi:[ribosomal protein S5]-alanine N-acetyltransferase